MSEILQVQHKFWCTICYGEEKKSIKNWQQIAIKQGKEYERDNRKKKCNHNKSTAGVTWRHSRELGQENFVTNNKEKLVGQREYCESLREWHCFVLPIELDTVVVLSWSVIKNEDRRERGEREEKLERGFLFGRGTKTKLFSSKRKNHFCFCFFFYFSCLYF